MNKKRWLLLATPGLLLFLAAAGSEGLPNPGTLLVPGLIILLLVLINGFFVASEFAIIGIRTTQMEELYADGNAPAGRVLEVIKSPVYQDRYIATAQLGITIASLGLGMYGEPVVAHFLEPYLANVMRLELESAIIGTIGYLVSLSLLTYLHIVIGEMVPKSMALSTPVKTVLKVTPIMRVIQKVLLVPVLLLNAIGNLMLRLFRVPLAQGQDRLHTAEEIEMIVAASVEEGLIEVGEEEMIRNIFDFGEREVGQVMTPRPKIQGIDQNLPYEELKRLVTESRHSRFPVYQEDIDHIVGILHLKDLVKYDMDKNPPITWRTLIKKVPAVPENQKVEELLAHFKQMKMHMAIVLDEFGGVAGIVTLEDLVEEVVGEVRDEFDQETEPYVKLEPGVIEVVGNYLVEFLLEDVDLGEEAELPDVETVGGLIVSWLGRPPVVGDTVMHHNTSFTVLDVDGLAISRARVEFTVPHPAGDEDE